MKEKTKFILGWLLFNIVVACLVFQFLATMQNTGFSIWQNYGYILAKIILTICIITSNVGLGVVFLRDYSDKR